MQFLIIHHLFHFRGQQDLGSFFYSKQLLCNFVFSSSLPSFLGMQDNSRINRVSEASRSLEEQNQSNGLPSWSSPYDIVSSLNVATTSTTSTSNSSNAANNFHFNDISHVYGRRCRNHHEASDSVLSSTENQNSTLGLL